jgi:MoxR-like ATPase
MAPTREYVFARPDTQPDKDRREPYVADDALVQAVNLAIYLGRPLLLEGEAGCGKSRLAYVVADQLGLDLFRWDVRSTSRAREGLYTYDAVLRLHDVQTTHLSGGRSATRDPQEPKDYRTFGALGNALRQTGKPAVVLIDEVDKADVDFPNDLLTVIDDEWAFEIPETEEQIKAEPDYRPIVIITSNKEKGNLPAPFLRRCVYHYITFPSETDLRRIVAAHIPPDETFTDTMLHDATTTFTRLRSEEAGLFKKPGISEFLDWIKALRRFPAAGDLAASTQLPHSGLLLKQRRDWLKYVGKS